MALVLYVAAFAVLALAGSRRTAWIVALAAALLVAAAVVLQLALRRAREEHVLPLRARLAIPGAMIAAGIGLVLYWLLGTPTGGWGLAGLCALYIGTGHLLAEWRASNLGAPLRGVLVSAGCAALFAAGVYLCIELSAYWLALSGAALLLAPIGLTLLSEDVMRRRRLRSWLVMVPGALLALGGAVWLVEVTGVPPVFAWGLVGALVVLVGAIASSSQADVLLVVTVVALAWTTIPHGVDARPALAANESTLVALGDSYMSGEGASEFYDGTNDADRNECRRSPTAYAQLVVDSGRPGAPAQLAFFACSGAVAAHIHERPQWPGEPIDDTPAAGADQLQQLQTLLDRSRVDVRLVIVSIGGNDAGFARIGVACLAPGSCVERGQVWLDGLERVAARVGRAYREIRSVVGTEVPVLAVPYPQPISERSCGYSLLESDEHRFLHGFVQQLDGAIRQAARDAGFYYLGAMQAAFADQLRICDGPEDRIGVNFIALRSVNGLVDQAVNPAKWVHNSLHPNERGHEAMARILEEWIESHPDPPARPDPRDQPEPFAPASLEQVMGTPETSYCRGPREPSYCERGDDAWTVTQLALLVRDAALPVLAVVLGIWLLWLPVLARTRRFWERAGGGIEQRLLGPPQSPSSAAAAVHTASST
jgi:lysophospholipase L1-like esterase